MRPIFPISQSAINSLFTIALLLLDSFIQDLRNKTDNDPGNILLITYVTRVLLLILGVSWFSLSLSLSYVRCVITCALRWKYPT